MSVRRIRISGVLLNSFLRNNELWTSDLPADVNVIGITREDVYAQTFVLLVESKDFPAVLVGELTPFIDPTFKRKAQSGQEPSLERER